MQVPVRLSLLFRPSVPAGVLIAIGYSSVVFMSTPFVLPEVALHYNVTLAAASLMGVLQLGGFVISSWAAGRWLHPSPRVFLVALYFAAIANLASAALPPYVALVSLRLLSGTSLGILTWYGWVQAFGDDRRMGDVAVVGPMVLVVSGPVVALLVSEGGLRSLFLVLGALAVVPLLFDRGSLPNVKLPGRGVRNKATPAARIILVCLILFTVGGSTVFQYTVVLGTGEPGLSTFAIGLAFSLNAVASIPSARWRGNRGVPSIWIVGTATAAFLLATTSNGVVFVAVMTAWGFAFWMAVPAVFALLASRSKYPEERAGDAQAVMAIGRVSGPFIGGVLIDGPGTTALGLVGGGLMLLAAVGVFSVRTITPPEQPVPLD